MSEVPISVITVCRNSMADLSASADSLLSALGLRDEWVIQDGDSTDGTQEYLKNRNDTRIQLESCPDAGIYDALNRAVARSAGQFLLVLGSDDRLRIHLDEVRSFLTDPYTLYYGDVWRTETNDRYAGAFDAAKLARTNICQQAIFYPRAAFKERQFDLRYAQQADWVFNMACHADDSLRFQYLDVLVADYAQQGVSSLKMDEAFQRDYRRLLKQYFPFSKRWRPVFSSLCSDMYRALPGVPAPRQTAARSS